MKRLIIVATIVAIALVACKQQETISDSTLSPVVKLSFIQQETKGFFGDSSTAESWEKKLNSVKLLVYNPSGEFVLSRQFVSTEIVAGSAQFPLPKSLAEKECTFVIVANYDIEDCPTLIELRSVCESLASSYNSTFGTVSTSSARNKGFVLSGECTKKVAAIGGTTTVEIALKRTVAKVAVKIIPSDLFIERYFGIMTINNVKISSAASRSTILASGTQNTGTMNYTHTQAPVMTEGYAQSLFYLYSSPSAEVGSRVKLEADCTYDADGDESTTSDKVDVVYSTELAGSGSGAIIRNGYYRVSLTLNGLSGEKCSAEVTVSDWETPVSQDIEMGI